MIKKVKVLPGGGLVGTITASEIVAGKKFKCPECGVTLFDDQQHAEDFLNVKPDGKYMGC